MLLNTKDLPAIFADVEITIPLDPPVLTASPTIKLPVLREKSGANLIWDPVTSYVPVPVEEYVLPVPVLVTVNVFPINVTLDEAYILIFAPVTPKVLADARISKFPTGLKNCIS